MTTAWVDGDLLLWRVLTGGGGGDPAAFSRSLLRWLGEAPDHTGYVVAFSDCDNFRKLLCKSYKSRRGPRPHGYEAMRARAMGEHPCRVLPGLEADDAIGLEMGEGFSVSTDKDMMSVPGRHWNPVRRSLAEVSPEQADLNWLRQALTGDAADDYPGLPGVGAAKASRVLPRCEPLGVLWGRYLRAWLDAGRTPEEAVTSARLARILRPGDYEDGAVVWREPAAAFVPRGPEQKQRPAAPAQPNASSSRPSGHSFGRR